ESSSILALSEQSLYRWSLGRLRFYPRPIALVKPGPIRAQSSEQPARQRHCNDCKSVMDIISETPTWLVVQARPEKRRPLFAGQGNTSGTRCLTWRGNLSQKEG